METSFLLYFLIAYVFDAIRDLNQLRGYLLDGEFNGGKIGTLLYPMVNNDLQTGKVQRIEGISILVKTINLNADWQEIEADMLDFVKRIEKTYQRL